MRGTSNSNARGNTRDRVARKAYLFRVYESEVPGHCRCYRCGVVICPDDCTSTYHKLWGRRLITIDRIIPGCKGGRYIRTNIRPACADCNSETGGRTRGTP